MVLAPNRGAFTFVSQYNTYDCYLATLIYKKLARALNLLYFLTTILLLFGTLLHIHQYQHTQHPVDQTVLYCKMSNPNNTSARSGLKIKLRCIQSALHGSPPPADANNLKRKAGECVTHPEDDTDSEIDIMPRKSRAKEISKAASPTPIIQAIAPAMKRNQRMLDPTKPCHAALIAKATKAGAEYYDSDADELPGDDKDTTKRKLFCNVAWGAYTTDYSNDDEFKQSPSSRSSFLGDHTVRDQKHKLVVKLIDKAGKKRIFANPPPRDWSAQEAISALNKRTVQQIRRNTSVRFREAVQAYVAEERRWILANLTSGKPTKGWKTFVEEFNEAFEGKTLVGTAGARPSRTLSSLTKEVERFGADFYGKGLVPVAAKKDRMKK
ncbi:hypothetical protein GMOD_00003533 [Pyrenophora seminiperda CCB06]|uniref:Uncharacterized protein n=1 Tax=Pyrenophora seminiperda CCB06 TaxID=1302712 RepID=A0A3M7MIX1_9PLEO|nr:hypothetical protein GMOD_00003533 [Pyrenophora seminiperda CCB06]